jgi:septal ring factor EnvC (AmiA/AmiB activator)
VRRIVSVAGVIALALALTSGSAPPVAAQQDSVETAKRKELEDIQNQAREKREAASRLRGQENRELSQLRTTERELSRSRRRLRSLQDRQRALDVQLGTARADVDRSQSALSQQRVKLARRLRNLYKFGVGRQLEFLLSTQSFAQLLARWDYLVLIAEQDRTLVEDVMAHKSIAEASKERLETTLTDVQNNTRRTDREGSRLAQLRQQRATSVRSIQSQRQNYEAAAEELEKTAREIRGLLAQLERKRREESDKAKREGRSPQPYTGDFAHAEGSLDWPARGAIIGRFGQEKHPKWGTVTMNNGIDIQVPIGTPVRAVGRGRVDYVSDDFGSYGELVILNHGDGYYTLYGHLSSIAVSVGNEVAPGQTIGRSGESGSLKGPALHFEVRKGGQSMDPIPWLQP